VGPPRWDDCLQPKAERALAACLGLRHGSLCQLSVVEGVAAAQVVGVEPATPDDWEVLEQNSGHLEEVLLSQVGKAFLRAEACALHPWDQQQWGSRVQQQQ